MWRAECILCVENFKFIYKVRIFNSDANTQIFFSFLGTGFKLLCPSFLIFPLYILIDSHQIIPSPCSLWSWKVVNLRQRTPLPVCSPDICLITLRVSVFKDSFQTQLCLVHLFPILLIGIFIRTTPDFPFLRLWDGSLGFVGGIV